MSHLPKLEAYRRLLCARTTLHLGGPFGLTRLLFQAIPSLAWPLSPLTAVLLPGQSKSKSQIFQTRRAFFFEAASISNKQPQVTNPYLHSATPANASAPVRDSCDRPAGILSDRHASLQRQKLSHNYEGRYSSWDPFSYAIPLLVTRAESSSADINYIMADLAREEADRYFSHRDHSNSHPEDRDRDSAHLSDDQAELDDENISDPGTDDDNTAGNMATMTTTRTTYHLPTQTHYANTGPKGVIADAQNFQRAKQTTFRQRLTTFAKDLTANSKSTAAASSTEKKSYRKSLFGTSPKSTTSSNSDNIAISDDEADLEFMQTWRANRLQELSSQTPSAYHKKPSQRSWGTLQEVDATGYLDAIEKVSDDTVVVVMIHDPSSPQSVEVEDELGMLAYSHNTIRFVKLHYEIAEMESVEIPAVLAYKAGDVFATISGAKAEGLEGVLLQ